MKFKFTITATVEYDVDPEFYPDSKTPEEMLGADLKNANDDTFMFLEMPGVEWDIKGEIVEN